MMTFHILAPLIFSLMLHETMHSTDDLIFHILRLNFKYFAKMLANEKQL